MSSTRTKLVTGVAVVAATAGGATFANAATNAKSSATTSTTASKPDADHQGPHTVNGKSEAALTGATKTKVQAAALAKVPGTVERVETNVDGSAPYEAHITKADGTEVEVQVSKDFTVVASNSMGDHGGGDHDGPGQP